MRHDRGPAWSARFAAWLLAAGAALWLCACFGEDGPRKVAGGTGSEAGDAYGVAWSVVGEKAAASARVTLFVRNDTAQSHPVPYAETKADGEGKFRFAIARDGHYDLEIRSSGDDAILYKKDVRIPAPGETDLGRLSLPASAKFRGRLPAAPTAPTRVWLEGTPYSAAVDSLGEFEFAPLPAGTYQAYSERSVADPNKRGVRVDLGELKLVPGDSIAPPELDTTRADTLKPVKPDSGKPVIPADAVMIEDFADGGEISTYGAIHGGGKWSAKAVGDMPMFPMTGFFDACIKAEGGFLGKSLHVTYSGVLSAGTAIVELDMEADDLIGKVPDTLIFWAKGSGSLRVETLLWTAATAGGTGDRVGNFIMDLSPQWQEFHFPLLPAGNARRPGYIRFLGSGGTEYSLDEIMFKDRDSGATVPEVPAPIMDSVLIENFDDGGEISSYGSVHGDGRWTATAEGGMPMYPTTGTFDAHTTIANGGPGKSLAVAYQGDQSSLKATVELDMGSKDLAGPAPDSLVFWARGRGVLDFDALLWTMPGNASLPARKAKGSLTLTTAWKRYRIPLTAESANRVPGYIRFAGSQGDSFYLNDIHYLFAKP